MNRLYSLPHPFSIRFPHDLGQIRCGQALWGSVVNSSKMETGSKITAAFIARLISEGPLSRKFCGEQPHDLGCELERKQRKASRFQKKKKSRNKLGSANAFYPHILHDSCFKSACCVLGTTQNTSVLKDSYSGGEGNGGQTLYRAV